MPKDIIKILKQMKQEKKRFSRQNGVKSLHESLNENNEEGSQGDDE